MINVRKLDDRSILVNGQGYHATWKARTLGDDVILEEGASGIIIKAHYVDFYIVDDIGEGRTYDSAIETMRALNVFVGAFGSGGEVWQ
jgi:hypothetical protein